MKRAIGLMVLVLFVFGFSIQAFALSGFKSHNLFRVRASITDNRDFNDDTDDSQQYFDQVLESIGTYEPLEGYTIGWKVKIAEGTWGYDFGQDDPIKKANEDKEIEVETLYAGFDQKTYKLNVGLIPAEFGNGWVLQSDGFPGTILYLNPNEGWGLDLLYSKLDENDYQEGVPAIDATIDEDGTEDQDLYGLQFGKKWDGNAVNAYFLSEVNRENTHFGEGEIHAIGLSMRLKLGSMEIDGEATHFTGENDTTGNDYVGNQAYLGGAYNFESLRLQANLYYAQSAEAGETQVSEIYKQGKVQPFQFGFGPMIDHDDDNLQMFPKPTSVFQLTPNSGVIGASLSGTYKVNEPIILGAGIIYLQPEDEDMDVPAGLNGNLISWTDLKQINLSINYSFNKNLMIGLGGSYKMFDSDEENELDDGYCVTSMLAFFF